VQIHSREDGFTITEMLVSLTVTMMITAAALTTFRNALAINETAGQLADANQNLRAGTNQLVRDIMMAGRIIGASGVPAPNSGSANKIVRPGPPGSTLYFNFVEDDQHNLTIPSLTTGYQLGPNINGAPTDMVTILTVDEFMEAIQGISSGTPTGLQGVLAADGSTLTLPATSPWLIGNTDNDTKPINEGDLILFKNANGMAIQTVTSKTSTVIKFEPNHTKDVFRFNQRALDIKGQVLCIKSSSACDMDGGSAPTTSGNFPATTMMRALMITYYVDNITTPSIPRLTRQLNGFQPQALAGVVEDLDLTYDVVDSVRNPTNMTSLPAQETVSGTLYKYTSNMIRKVNIHVGVRSEVLSKPSQDYVRNHISTSVDVRSLASVDKYNTSQ
jgi:type II secretory pathway pseudopilin PulG